MEALKDISSIIGYFTIAIIAYTIISSYLKGKLPPLQVSASNSGQTKAEVIDQWLEKLNSLSKFNGAILILKKDQVLLQQAYGYGDVNKKKKLTAHTPFRLASVSKQFTAVGILTLVQNGEIRLDDPLKKYIEDFPYPKVTVRQLLNQTSGIPDDYMELAKEHRSEVNSPLCNQDVLQLFCKYKPELDHKAGAEYEYSNTDYVLLAALIEKVSTYSFEEYMTKAVFTPMGMKSSRVWNLNSMDDFTSRAHDLDLSDEHDWEEEHSSWIDGVAGDGAVFSSLEDFIIWDKLWNGNSLINAELVEEAFAKSTLNDGSKSNYGFGWVIEENYKWHNGSWLGARTYYARQNKGLSFVILDNSSNERIDKIAKQIRRALDF